MFGRPLTMLIAAMLVPSVLAAVAGCGRLLYRFSTPVPETFIPNPVDLPPVEDTFVWLQVVDVADDYFRIQREQPVQNRPELVLQGRLETSYQIGASLLEPWRKDSTAGFERLQSTLQSIRRRATIVVQPTATGYSLEVVVLKELEDTDRSQDATEGASAIRHDGTVLRKDDLIEGVPSTLGWIPLGRDASLEQVILQDILGRVTQPDGGSLLHH